MDYGLKWLKIYSQLSYKFFFAIILNYTTFCDTHALYRQYTGIHQKGEIYSLLLNVIAQNFFKNYDIG